jgi:hypothetical protein
MCEMCGNYGLRCDWCQEILDDDDFPDELTLCRDCKHKDHVFKCKGCNLWEENKYRSAIRDTHCKQCVKETYDFIS